MNDPQAQKSKDISIISSKGSSSTLPSKPLIERVGVKDKAIVLSDFDPLVFFGLAKFDDLYQFLEKMRDYFKRIPKMDHGDKHRVITVATELMQNTLHHSTFKYDGACRVLWVFEAMGDTLNFVAANELDRAGAEALRAKIQMLNSYPREVVGQRYLEELGNGEFTSLGGAGLGLLVVAKKSTIQCRVEPISSSKSLVYLGASTRLKNKE